MREQLEERGMGALRRFVRGADDARLERTLGSERGLAVLFEAMRRAYVPAGAGGWRGEVLYELRTSAGQTHHWTVAVGRFRAEARRGTATEPKLIIQTGVAHFVRMAAGELDVGSALLMGQLDLRGDIAVAMRLGPMFGQGAA